MPPPNPLTFLERGDFVYGSGRWEGSGDLAASDGSARADQFDVFFYVDAHGIGHVTGGADGYSR